MSRIQKQIKTLIIFITNYSSTMFLQKLFLHFVFRTTALLFQIISKTMYIDSPQFPKRRVVNNQNQLNGGFGYERIQLANYVADQLNNNHKDDAIILQRFRKQAQQYKRNLLKRKHLPIQSKSQPSFQPISFPQAVKFKPLTIHPSKRQVQITPTQMSDEIDQRNFYKEDRFQKNQMIVNEITKVPDQSNIYFIKMLEKKDKQLQKQSKIIRKNEAKLNDLKKRIQALQHEKKIKEADRVFAIQQSNYERMKGFIASISNKLQQNNSFIERNLSQINEYKKNSLSLRKSKGNQAEILYSPKPIKYRKSINPQTILEQPKISYNNYKISTESKIVEQKNGINQILTNLSSSRNRLDALGSFF